MMSKATWAIAGASVLALAACDPATDSPLRPDQPPTPPPVPTVRPLPPPSPLPTLPPYDYLSRWPDANLYVTRCVNTGVVSSDVLKRKGVVAEVGGIAINVDDVMEDYIISFYANTDQGQGTGVVQVRRVPPGATVNWSGTAVVTNSYPGKTTACGILNLNAAPS